MRINRQLIQFCKLICKHNLVIVLPLTRTDRRIPVHVLIEPPEGGVTARSYVLCDAVRSVATERLEQQPWGIVSAATLRRVEDGLRILMGL